jgi:RNA polymerase sigma factor (sigma-70 family)
MAELQTDPPDIEQVYRDHRLPLVRLGFLLTGSREDSEDLVQSAFATASAHWYEIEQPLAYLKRAVVNQASDLHKRRARERGRPAAEGVTEIPEVDETWAILQRLPHKQRMVVVLRFYEDLPLLEIAGLLDRPPATVRSDLRRALGRLRKALP